MALALLNTDFFNTLTMKNSKKILLVVLFVSFVSLVSAVLGWWSGFSSILETGAYELSPGVVKELRKLIFSRPLYVLIILLPLTALSSFFFIKDILKRPDEQKK